MIDLCKLFGVEEEEEFKITNSDFKYVIRNNRLKRIFNNLDEVESNMGINDLSKVNIIKLPKKKEFTDDELAIMRSLPIEIKWIARNSTKEIYGYEDKPSKHDGIWYRPNNGRYYILSAFSHIFKAITTEDEEAVFIDDYVERQGEE